MSALSCAIIHTETASHLDVVVRLGETVRSRRDSQRTTGASRLPGLADSLLLQGLKFVEFEFFFINAFVQL